MQLSEIRRRTNSRLRPWPPGNIILTHLLVAVLATLVLGALSRNPGGEGCLASAVLGLCGQEFFRQLLIWGLFLYSLIISASLFGFKPENMGSVVGGACALSVAISVLLASNPALPADLRQHPQSFWDLLYIMFVGRQVLLALLLVAVATVAVLSVALLRRTLTFHSGGTGLQIKLPGQVVYFLPIYPQMSWQNTGIRLRSGERIDIELTGYVSPGASGDMEQLRRHMDELVEWQRENLPDSQKPVLPESVIWPYSTPVGYTDAHYGPNSLHGALKKHKLYGNKERYYLEDRGLTVMGQPHNRVFGLIVSGGEDKPREAIGTGAAYNWNLKEDQEQLLCLSHESYPQQIDVKKSAQELHLHNDGEALPAEKIWECLRHRFWGSASAFWQMSSWPFQ
ncbi:hypothetical protein, partial [Deinococcus planocerae]|uniref:hypothetical protein n=1 Tax=Deinococcus planocerae TaxID=1737569 RepID=UPI0011AF3F40